MEKMNKRLGNQAMGLLPLLLFMILDNYLSYLLSFVVGVSFCFVSIFTYQTLKKDKIFQFLLVPSGLTLVLYSLFLCFKLEPLLFIYSPLIIEMLLVVVLAFFGFSKRFFYKHIRNAETSLNKRSNLRTLLGESFFVSQLVQNFYTLHLFFVLIYNVLPETMQNEQIEYLLFRQMGIIIGFGIIAYEQVRMSLLKGRLKKESWLPVLNEQGNVVGCIAGSVSLAVPKKYYHPVVRMAVVYKGMLYLTERKKDTIVSPEMIDYPFYSYVLFRQSLENTVHEIVKKNICKKTQTQPRHMLRYTFENENVKSLVNLYVMVVRTEAEMNLIKREKGKLWTAKQIEDNLGTGLFSEYFEQEFEYLQHTVLLAESMMADQDEILTKKAI